MPFELTSGLSSPSPDQLVLINKYRPAGTPEYEASEIMVVTMRASHNLLHKSFNVWTPESLLAMAQQYPGRPLELNHDWYDVASTVGFVFDAQLMSIPQVRPECGTVSPEINRDIVSKYGYYELYLQAAIEAGTPIHEGIRFRRLSSVSTGTMNVPALKCPTCNTSYSNPACPHIPNTDFVRYLIANNQLSDEQLLLVSPYNLIGEIRFAEECSLVNSGNLPGAEILRAA